MHFCNALSVRPSVRPLRTTSQTIIGSDWQPISRSITTTAPNSIHVGSDLPSSFLSERPIMSHFAPTREMASSAPRPAATATAPRPTRARWGISQLRPKNKAVKETSARRMRLGTDRRAHHPVLTEVKSKLRLSGDGLGEMWTFIA